MPVAQFDLTELKPVLGPVQDRLTPAEVDLIRRAYELAKQAHAGQTRASGEPFIRHPVAVAAILADMKLDSRTIAAALLHDTVEDAREITPDRLRQEFGDEVAKLVDGVTKLARIDAVSRMGQRDLVDEEAEDLRKMFLAMVDDVRVVLIKLADRLHNMRTLSALPAERRLRIARQTLDIFAPLANRLGIWQIKWELEDLAFRCLEPQLYKEIGAKIQQREADRERYLAQVKALLQHHLKLEGIRAEVTGRPKHIYSIYRKMQRKGVGFDQIYDIHGVRIIVDDVKDCYAALGIVHSLWTPIPGEFDDFIATPKDNMYQSLHTAVIGPKGHPLEVQIRTREMHRIAEYGIAAHWRYKDGIKRDQTFENKVAWLRSLMDWRKDVTDAREFLAGVRSDVLDERVYVFTPQGDVIDLRAGATPIDFAYQIHTEVGHRCRGAKVNGKLVSLDYQLQTGDQVEIITAKRGGPSRDWLNPNLGFVRTAHARSKIRQWFRRQDRQDSIAQGRALLDRELRRLGVSDVVTCEDLARRFGYEKGEDFLAAIGFGDINPQQLTARALQMEREARGEAPLPETIERAVPTPLPQPAEGVQVLGVGDVLTTLARCCRPAPGDEIVGYVTRGRGVTVHRRDCPNVLRLLDTERLINVSWGSAEPATYPVVIEVRAWDREGLVRDVATVVAGERVNMSALNTVTTRKNNIATMVATLEISSVSQLSRILTKIGRLPNVLEVHRVGGGKDGNLRKPESKQE